MKKLRFLCLFIFFQLIFPFKGNSAYIYKSVAQSGLEASGQMEAAMRESGGMSALPHHPRSILMQFHPPELHLSSLIHGHSNNNYSGHYYKPSYRNPRGSGYWNIDWAVTSIVYDVLGLIPVFIPSIVGIVCGFKAVNSGRRVGLGRAGIYIGFAEIAAISVLLLFLLFA